MDDTDGVAARTRRLLEGARYLNLATARDGLPWVATLEYVWFPGPLRLVFGSSTGSRHSGDLARDPRVSGALFVTGAGSGVEFAPVDGAQFTGRCEELAPERLAEYYEPFYEGVFPDPGERERWRLAPALLAPPAVHRLYLVTVDRWWLIDTRTWAEDRVDRRTEVAPEELAGVRRTT
ncbi:pyridoxamine 5'-phosphate oxidase family protein [Streptomyces sp. NPDC004539]|uniref:pyridoxamine 5'-phosphate oxidase family protein n=1 Tax=Streptomyces sp. NPDC004539 TaxID=3154280 RepID=UPI0033BB64C7